MFDCATAKAFNSFIILYPSPKRYIKHYIERICNMSGKITTKRFAWVHVCTSTSVRTRSSPCDFSGLWPALFTHGLNQTWHRLCTSQLACQRWKYISKIIALYALYAMEKSVHWWDENMLKCNGVWINDTEMDCAEHIYTCTVHRAFTRTHQRPHSCQIYSFN